jgi:phosphoglycolate phosphatase-like HAD superfamily hydrolase
MTTSNPDDILIPSSGDFAAWPRSHDACIAVDWDGTCKDTMAPKWAKGFNLAIPQIWPQLAPYQEAIDRVCWQVNLVEETAGVQRFVALKIMMARWAAMGLPVPDLSAFSQAVEDVIRRGERHGIDTYRRLQAQYGYDDSPLRWSDLSDRIIAENTRDAKLFEGCREALEGVAGRADLLVVSASKTQAVREDLIRDRMGHLFGALLAQDFLPKPGILKGLSGRYRRLLFVGDTREDIRSAASAGVPLFLVEVGQEARSWAKAPEVFDRFLRGETFPGGVVKG